MLLSVVIVLILLFFPIYVEGCLYYDVHEKKLGVAVYLFKKWKIIGGYLSDYPGGFAFHTSRDKVFLLPLNDRENQKKRISVFRLFKLTDFAVNTETGADYLPLSMLFNSFLKGYFFWQGGEKKNYQNHIWLKDGDYFSVSIDAVARVNFYMQICALIRLIKERANAKQR